MQVALGTHYVPFLLGQGLDPRRSRWHRPFLGMPGRLKFKYAG